MSTFEWNESKSRRNRIAHGVAFDEAVGAFADPLGRIIDDPRHSREESRYALIAQSERGASSPLCALNEESGSA